MKNFNVMIKTGKYEINICVQRAMSRKVMEELGTYFWSDKKIIFSFSPAQHKLIYKFEHSGEKYYELAERE